MDGQLDIHLIGHLEQKWEKTRFVRVDSDVIEKLIQKEDTANVSLSEAQREALTIIFNSQLPPMEKTNFIITFEQLGPNVNPVLITQNEFMRRMKEMSAMQGGMMNFYGEMPDSYNLVVNTTHPLIEKLLKDEETACAEELAPIEAELSELSNKLQQLKENHKNKKEEEIPAEEKEELTTLEKRIDELKEKRKSVLAAFASNYKTVRQLIDLALLGNNMLKGEALANFVKRSIDLM